MSTSSTTTEALESQPSAPVPGRSIQPRMRDRSHPGEMLREFVFGPRGLSVTEAAARLQMSRVALSRVLNERAGISADLAVRLEMAGESTARFWMALQSSYEIDKALERGQPDIAPLGPLSEDYWERLDRDEPVEFMPLPAK